MLDIQFIRDHSDKVKQAIINKHLPPRVNVEVVDRILELDEKRRTLIRETEDIRRDRNELAEKLKTSRSEACRQKQLEKDLGDVNNALEALQANPEVLKIMCLISKVRY